MKRRHGKKRQGGKARRNGAAATRPRPDGLPTIDLGDHLGSLVPHGVLTEGLITAILGRAMERKRFAAGVGVPSAPTRYVVTMHPCDRAWLNPFAEDRVAASLERHADRLGTLIVGDIIVAFEADDRLAVGRPRIWVGFAEDDLLVLADADAAAQVFARR